MNKKGGVTANLFYIALFVFLAVFFFAPQYIGMEESSKKTRQIFSDIGNLFTFQDAAAKKHGQGSREADPFKRTQGKGRYN